MSSRDAGGLTIGFLHTSPAHVATFEGLLAEVTDEVGSVSVVDETLLARARSLGPFHPDVVEGVASALDTLESAEVSTIICTCSTIGGVAEVLGKERTVAVVRVDRAMAEVAIETGTHIAVVAALESTFAPTRQLIEAVASARGLAIEIDDVLCQGSWELFEAGDTDGYLQAVATTCDSLSGNLDVIVLAQASMAGAEAMASTSTPILSSPLLAVETAAHCLRDEIDRGSDR